ncbi:MAG: carbohydrate kinase family protein [Lentisphaerae bacterium]|nr:carbohydrate kinase family protein [Lentisphaerota bacterium]
MSKKAVNVSVVGCSLVDCVYAKVDFNSAAFKKYSSLQNGDGGLVPGQLVFMESLEKFSGVAADQMLAELTGNAAPSARNVGGPAVVAAINAAQLCSDYPVKVKFYGARGKDEGAELIEKILKQTPLDITNYQVADAPTPSTQVLSDPTYHNGKGERTFINVIGAANDYTPQQLGDEFFESDVLVFSATALMPPVHDNLTALLKRGKAAGKINMVATVFDFRNEMRDPVGRWPLGESDESYKYIDIMAVDWDEARRLSGEEELEKIVDFFASRGVSSMLITHGAKNFHVYSDGRLFNRTELSSWAVNELVNQDLAQYPERRGDTTGCGDNFAGGLLASLIMQLSEGKTAGELDMRTAAAWADASGGFACFCLGGTYIEKAPGEKYALVKRYCDYYLANQ